MTPGHKPKLVVGIPAFAERDWLPKTLDVLAQQTQPAYEVWVCVNQPADCGRKNPEAAQDNCDMLAYLHHRADAGSDPFHLVVVDATRMPIPPKKGGVGWARHLIFEQVCRHALPQTICISMDADTLVPADYLEHVATAFDRYPNAIGCVVNYYHPTPQDPTAARSLLRYEIYMRYYQTQLWRIGSPYAFTALGSAIAFRADSYLPVRGFPPRSAGEDFYFLQALRKKGPLIRLYQTQVQPASRKSVRVPFGTGRAVELNTDTQQKQYPLYAPQHFDRIGETLDMFPALYENPEQSTSCKSFFDAKFRESPFAKIRKNTTTRAGFVRACHEKFDGLRTLQALRFYQQQTTGSKIHLTEADYLRTLLQDHAFFEQIELDTSTADIPSMEKLRDALQAIEISYQKKFMDNWNQAQKW